MNIEIDYKGTTRSFYRFDVVKLNVDAKTLVSMRFTSISQANAKLCMLIVQI